MTDHQPEWDHDLEAELVAAARSGDSAAFRAIVVRFDSGLRGLAYRMLRDRHRMDDVLQEAYIKAFRALPGFDGRSRLGTWLYRITYNACVDELRRLGHQEWVELDDCNAREVGPDPSDRVTDRVLVEEALSRLPPGYQAVLVLIDGHGFDYAAAAEVLGIAGGTVASRLHRARQAMLRTLMERSTT